MRSEGEGEGFCEGFFCRSQSQQSRLPRQKMRKKKALGALLGSMWGSIDHLQGSSRPVLPGGRVSEHCQGYSNPTIDLGTYYL